MDTQFIESILEDENNKLILKTVLNHPYIERKELADQLSFSVDQVDETCQPLIDNSFLFELSSQATSNIESRVPRKVYLINPEIEQTIKESF